MTPTETTTILRQFNKWLLGNTDGPQLESHMIRKAIGEAVEMIDRLEAAEKEREMDEKYIADLLGNLNRVGHENDTLRTALADLLNDLEERAKWNLEESQRVVACGNGVYVRAKAALEESK